MLYYQMPEVAVYIDEPTLVIEGHNKQCTEPVTTCNTPCVHFSHNFVTGVCDRESVDLNLGLFFIVAFM